jgi:hypothetical protein
MQCGMCGIAFHDNAGGAQVARDVDGIWEIESYICPSCNRANIFLVGYAIANKAGTKEILKIREIARIMARPLRKSLRPVAHPDVPAKFSCDYNEACEVLPVSAKSSAALSRRCLQHLLRDHVNTKKKDLADQIDEVLRSNVLPSHLAELLDAIRVVGNFAAHPLKNSSTGEIVEVEVGEAEVILDTLVGLFDFFFVAPRRTADWKAALNEKLVAAGKPPVK